MCKWLKNPLFYVFVFVIGAVLHNLVYALFNFEEPFFFLIAILALPVGVVVLFYRLFCRVKKRKK